MSQVLLTGYRGGLGNAIMQRLVSATVYPPWVVIPVEVGDALPTSLATYEAVIVAQGANYPVEPREATRDYSTEWDANYHSVLLLAQQWIADKWGLPGRKPFIVLVSNSAIIPRTNSLHYCASKAAIDMSLKVLHRQYAWYGYEFYSLCSAAVTGTPMTNRVFHQLGEEAVKKTLERLPLRRFVGPEEIVEWVWFLLTNPAAVLAAGQSLRLDSGEH